VAAVKHAASPLFFYELAIDSIPLSSLARDAAQNEMLISEKPWVDG